MQSVVLRLVCEREAAIEAFAAREFWSVGARLRARGGHEFEASLVQVWRNPLLHMRHAASAAHQRRLQRVSHLPWVGGWQRRECQWIATFWQCPWWEQIGGKPLPKEGLDAAAAAQAAAALQEASLQACAESSQPDACMYKAVQQGTWFAAWPSLPRLADSCSKERCCRHKWLVMPPR